MAQEQSGNAGDEVRLLHDKSPTGSLESTGNIHAVITRRGTEISIPVYITDYEPKNHNIEKYPYLKKEENVFFSLSELPKRKSKVAKGCFIMTIFMILILVVMALIAGVRTLCNVDSYNNIDDNKSNITLILEGIISGNTTDGVFNITSI